MSKQSSRPAVAHVNRPADRRSRKLNSGTLPVSRHTRRKKHVVLEPEPVPHAALPPDNPKPPSLRRAIRLPSVLEIVPCGRSHWYALLNKKSAAHDSTAPQPFKLGPSTHSPSVWWEHEVLEWLEARAQRRFH
jgi:predicted DNA-binding transcriptional regulator AlpA